MSKLDKFNDKRLVHPLNIEFIYSTDLVLKDDKSNDFNDSHPSNILCISLTEDVSNKLSELIFTNSKYLQSLKVFSIVVTNVELKLVKSTSIRFVNPEKKLVISYNSISHFNFNIFILLFKDTTHVFCPINSSFK